MNIVRYFQIALVIIGYSVCGCIACIVGTPKELLITAPISTVLIIIGCTFMELTGMGD